MLWLSALINMGAMLTGTYLSFFLDSAPAPTIILILTAVFVLAFIRRQMLTRRASLRRVENG
jgi:manganese/iron transport system permease protein